MIATVSIRVSAANPQAPLGPFYVYEGSAASVTIIDVPRKFGGREITGVSLLARNVMDEERGIPCVRVGSAWGATVPDTFYTRSGQINDNGFVVQAEGVDENGDPVVWILGRSTVLVMDATGYILPNAVRKYVRWNLTVPAKPELGDMCILGDGSVAIYTERLWQRIGVSGNPISRDDVAGVLPLPSQFTENQMKDKINELLSHLKGTVALAFAAFGFAAFGGVTVQTAPKGEVLNTQPIVTNVVYEADSLARPLPKYLHALDFYDSYPAEAAWYYEQRGSGALAASCSAVRDGNTLSRNFDYPFDERAEFVVKMAAGAGRFASVGVAQVGTNITEAMATSGKQLPPQFYKALPGATVDGVNENGVVCEINVVDGEPAWHTGGDIHPLGAVRWALDHGTSAAMVASNLAARVAFPSGWAQNFHYMIADERETWIVENGAAHLVDGTAVMTNFRLYPTHSGGEGRERYALLAGGAAITNAWFTRAYLRTTNWTSEFKDAAEMEAAKSAWETHTKEQLRGKGLWQSVHTSIYDITNRTLRVAVQESADFYTFAVPSAGGGKVKSVNGKDGEVVLNAADVGAADIDDFDFLDSFVRTNTIPKTNRIFYNDDPAYGAWHFMGYADGLRISSGTAAYSPSIRYDNSIGMWKMKNPHIGSDLIAGHKDIAFSINSLSNSVMPIALSARDNAFSADTKATAAQTAASAADAKANAAQTHSEETRAIVYTWEQFLDGSNVVFSITNYISGTYSLDHAKFRILEMRDGQYREVYNSRTEITNHTEAAKSEVVGFVNEQMTELRGEIAQKGDKAWGSRSSTGQEVPISNTVWVTQQNLRIAGGMEYERVAVGEGAIYVLASKGATPYMQGDEGSLMLKDDGGTNFFGMVRSDSYTIGCNTDGIRVDANAHLVYLDYNVTMSDHPVVWYKPTLETAEWEQLNLPDGSQVPGASHVVVWDQSPRLGAQECYINVGTAPAGFFTATIEVPGDRRFKTNMPAEVPSFYCTDDPTKKVKIIWDNGNPKLVEAN